MFSPGADFCVCVRERDRAKKPNRAKKMFEQRGKKKGLKKKRFEQREGVPSRHVLAGRSLSCACVFV